MKKLYTLLILAATVFGLFFFVNKFNSGSFTTQMATDGPATTESEYDLALTKKLSTNTPGPFYPGDNVEYILTVYNQGTVGSGPITVTDYMPSTLQFLTASETSSVQGSNLELSVGNIAAGSSYDITLSYKIDGNFVGGDISNIAEISADSGDDIDSNPDSDSGNDCIENDAIDKVGCAQA